MFFCIMYSPVSELSFMKLTIPKVKMIHCTAFLILHKNQCSTVRKGPTHITWLLYLVGQLHG